MNTTKPTKQQIIEKAKDQVAKRMGLSDEMFGGSWDYGMRIHSRTKRQLLMYEEVIDLLAWTIKKLKDRSTNQQGER